MPNSFPNKPFSVSNLCFQNSMEAETHISIVFFLFFVSISTFPVSSSQSQNIQTFYPFPLPPTPIVRPPSTTPNKPIPSLPPPPWGKSSKKGAVAKAVAATAVSTLVLSGFLFFFLQRRSRKKLERKNRPNPFSRDGRAATAEFAQFNKNIKGVVVDEDGLDVVYWRNLNGENVKKKFRKEVLSNNTKMEDEKVIGGREIPKKSELPIQEMPLLRDKSSSSHQVWQGNKTGNSVKNPPPPNAEKRILSIESSNISPPPPAPQPTPPPPKPLSVPPASPPPPIVALSGPAPPPPPPPKTANSASLPKPPPAPKGVPSENKQGESSSREGMEDKEKGQVKLKPLHWDKVNPNVEHPMVWHKIEGGSFQFDGDLMEALFGSIATNRKSPRNSASATGERSNSPPSQIIILDPRKSQNTAIVLRSLAITRKEIIHALIEGRGINVETLEKLCKIAPTKEEESQILAFDGDPTRLADAESFLFHLLKAIPSTFTRFDTMLFRSNYDLEILHLRDCLQTLEMGCKELRTRGLFLKLLEAILKAGNRMNAGTSRGNAQAFNLSSLRKLSDVKSTDGKTTLLHFVVEEVIRAEGKRCILNRNHSLNRSSSTISSGNSQNPDNAAIQDVKEKEYIMLGLPVVGGLSSEFTKVKKAATLDYDVFSKTCLDLSARVNEIRRVLTQWEDIEGGGFVKEMKSFVEIAEMELKVVKEEQTRIMELVKKTTEYYQAGSSKDKEKHPLQLFVIVKDFLDMVDKTCIDVARNSQKKRSVTTNVESSASRSSDTRNSVRFPVLPANFMSNGSSSDSDDETKKDTVK